MFPKLRRKIKQAAKRCKKYFSRNKRDAELQRFPKYTEPDLSLEVAQDLMPIRDESKYAEAGGLPIEDYQPAIRVEDQQQAIGVQDQQQAIACKPWIDGPLHWDPVIDDPINSYLEEPESEDEQEVEDEHPTSASEVDDEQEVETKKPKEDHSEWFKLHKQWCEKWVAIEAAGIHQNADEVYALFQALRSWTLYKSKPLKAGLERQIRHLDFTALNYTALPLTTVSRYVTPNLRKVMPTLPTPSEFPRFTKLPVEIQRHIWGYAAFGRVIRVNIPNGQDPRREERFPGVFLVCMASRVEALRCYKKFTVKIPKTPEQCGFSKTIYFHPARDTLLLDRQLWSMEVENDFLQGEDVQLLSSIAINALDYLPLESHLLGYWLGLKFPNLATLSWYKHSEPTGRPWKNGPAPIYELPETKRRYIHAYRLPILPDFKVHMPGFRPYRFNPQIKYTVLTTNGFYTSENGEKYVTEEEWKAWNAPWNTNMFRDTVLTEWMGAMEEFASYGGHVGQYHHMNNWLRAHVQKTGIGNPELYFHRMANPEVFSHEDLEILPPGADYAAAQEANFRAALKASETNPDIDPWMEKYK